jgi:hypothetical protein
MEGAERDSTQDWLLPAGAAPPLLKDLELRIDEVLAIARASEQAVGAVGEAAIDAAKQARRAAELAERASEAALDASRTLAAHRPAEGPSREAASRPAEKVSRAAAPNSAPAAILSVSPEGVAGDPPGDVTLHSFSERADRVVARLRALEHRPPRGRASSAAAGRRRPGG